MIRLFDLADEIRRGTELGMAAEKVMIMGGGTVGAITASLLSSEVQQVKLVEINRERCLKLAGDLPEVVEVVNGDGRNSDFLYEQGLYDYDAFVALTGDDGDNIITSMYAKHMNVGKIVVKVNREYYDRILDSAELDSVVAPKALVAQQLARYVRAMSNSMGSSMETLYKLADGKVEVLEFKVAEGSAVIGVPLKTLKLKPNIIISAIVRGNRTILPGGDTKICAGDHAVVVAKAGRLKALDDIVEE